MFLLPNSSPERHHGFGLGGDLDSLCYQRLGSGQETESEGEIAEDWTYIVQPTKGKGEVPKGKEEGRMLKLGTWEGEALPPRLHLTAGGNVNLIPESSIKPPQEHAMSSLPLTTSPETLFLGIGSRPKVSRGQSTQTLQSPLKFASTALTI
jgi:hypothetical protein